jgi:hypothetical protein
MIGVFGFLDFTTTTADDILINYCIQVTHDALMTAGKELLAKATGVVLLSCANIFYCY